MPRAGAGVPVEDLIARLCDQPGRVLTERDVGELGPAGDLLRRWGAVRQDENLTAVSCTSCGDDHPVELEYDPELRVWRYYCGSVGWAAVDEADLVTFRFDRGWLFDKLVEELRIRRPDRRCLVDDVLWQLGNARTGTAFWAAFVARDAAAHLDPILEGLRQAGGAYPGLVLTSSPGVPRRVRLPHGHRWVSLVDVLDAGDDRLGVHEAGVRAALSDKGARQPAPRPPGRPGVGDLMLEEFARRRQAGETCPSLRGEAAAIQGWLRATHPELGPRSRGTVENIIRRLHAEGASRDPRPTK